LIRQEKRGRGRETLREPGMVDLSEEGGRLIGLPYEKNVSSAHPQDKKRKSDDSLQSTNLPGLAAEGMSTVRRGEGRKGAILFCSWMDREKRESQERSKGDLWASKKRGNQGSRGR